MCINVETTNVNTEHTYITILHKLKSGRKEKQTYEDGCVLSKPHGQCIAHF